MKKFPLNEFGGENQQGEQSDVQPPWALKAQNCQFGPGYAGTRLGCYPHPSATFTDSRQVCGFYNHPYSDKSWVLRTTREPGNIGVTWNQYDGTGGATATLFITATPGYGTFAGFGRRVYAVGSDLLNESGRLAAIDLVSNTTPQVWMPPPTSTDFTTSSVTTFGTGQVTEGNHNFYILAESKTGFITRLGPINSISNGLPVAFLGASLLQNSSLAITLTPATSWNAEIVSLTLVATTSTNSARKYIVPNTRFVITNPALPVTFTFSIADVTLATGELATPWENIIYTGLDQAVSSDQPIKPYYCFQAGERLGLFFYDDVGPAMAFSDPSDYEHIALDRNVIRLPGGLKPSAGLWVQGTIYIFSQDRTFAYTDTGDDPVVWPQPREVDGKIGTGVPYGITLDSSGNGFVAHTTGLYPFSGGQFTQTPVTFWQPATWAAINWADPSFVMVDDKAKYRVMVSYRDISGTYKVGSWNYYEGFSPSRVKFSPYTYPFTCRWLGIVNNKGDARSGVQRLQLWLQSATQGKWMLDRSSLDAAKYTDCDFSGGAQVDYAVSPQRWRSAFLPSQDPGGQLWLHRHGLLRILGNGQYLYNVYGLDDVQSTTLKSYLGATYPIVLSAAAGKQVMTSYSMVNEKASLEVVLNDSTVGSFFVLSFLEHQYKLYARRRPS